MHAETQQTIRIETKRLLQSASSVGGLALLVFFADFLFWGYRTGFTLGQFGFAIFIVAMLRQPDWTSALKPLTFMILSTLPILEHVQVLSVGILLAGLLTSLAWLRVIRENGFGWVAAGVAKLVASIPFVGIAVSFAIVRIGREKLVGGMSESGAFVRNWAFPVGGALVLGALLISANPVLEHWTTQLFTPDVDVLPWLERAMFWCGLALLLLPLINPPKPLEQFGLRLPSWHGGYGLNAGSVLRALVIFNGFLAVQSLIDASILLGGAELPDGMSYSTYAHRGAYPLLATAMLAGLFTLAARPFLGAHVFLKPMLYLWVAQNVVLTVSAALRLDLYIGEYGLTYLRLYALIWMGLVAAGLLAVMWQLFKNHTTVWLLRRVATLGGGTLYLCAFINFAALIASDTMSRAADPAHTPPVDWSYLCDLGPTAAKAVASRLKAEPDINVPAKLASCFVIYPRPKSWREWDFRTAYTQWYLIDYVDGKAERTHIDVPFDY